MTLRHMLPLIALGVLSCEEQTQPEIRIVTDAPVVWFEEQANERGLDFSHRTGHGARYLFPQIIGGGAALVDIDNDGDLDAYLVQSGDDATSPGPANANQLYRNDGSGRFENITQDSGADDLGYGMGVASGDFDGDGHVDLYVTNLERNTLLRNRGDGTFEDVTERAGVGCTDWSTAAAFFDYDGDGDLDLFVVNYVHWSPDVERVCHDTFGRQDYCSPDAYAAPSRDGLYRNNGDGTFTDVSGSAGILSEVGNGLGIVIGDFNDDLRSDVYVANDRNRNILWINQGDGTFVNEALIAGCALDRDGKAKAGMGVDAVDVDGDADLDLLVVNLAAETDSYYQNQGGYFRESAARVGIAAITRSYTRFGVGFRDFNNDGRLDLFEANGAVSALQDPFGEDPYAEPNVLLEGGTGGRYQRLLPDGGTDPPLVAASRAAAFGDVDNDGRIDILVMNANGPTHLLMNITSPDQHWIGFDLRDELGRQALGAHITLAIGNRTLHRDVRTASSYLACNDARIHVGLGDETQTVEASVRWPDGSTSTFTDLAPDRYHTLRKTSVQ